MPAIILKSSGLILFLQLMLKYVSAPNQIALPDRKNILSYFILKFRISKRILIFTFTLLATLLVLWALWLQKSAIDNLMQPQAESGFLFFCVLMISVASHFCMMFAKFLCARESARVTMCLSDALYDHTLRLTAHAKAQRTVGQIVSMYAQDISSIASVFDDFLPSFASSVLPLVLAPLAISYLYHVSFLPVVIVAVVMLTVNVLIAKRQATLFLQAKGATDVRLSVVNEWLQNMRGIRALGWTSAFETRVLKTRKEESRIRKIQVSNGSFLNAWAQATPYLFNIAGLFSLVAVKRDTLTPGDIFSMLWVFGVFLSRPLRMLPWNLVVWLDGVTSANRIAAFLALEVEPAARPVDLAKPSESGGRFIHKPQVPSLVVSGLCVSIAGKERLNRIGFEAQGGQLIAIVGEVGSGKSLLLSALSGDVPCDVDSYLINGDNVASLSLFDLRAYFALVPQEPFVLNAKLANNVTFSYDDVSEPLMTHCVLPALQRAHFDWTLLPAGLGTEIGERGVNLSGGQKQRVNLARAQSTDRPVVLLDDCLSALDVDTEARVIEDLLLSHWKNSIKLLATHRLSVLPRCDRILFLKNGALVEDGTYEELIARSAEFRHFVIQAKNQ